jgi:hypothetical protein
MLGAFCAIPLTALLANDREVNAGIFKFDDFDAGAAAANLAGVKKGAVDLAATAARALRYIEGDHSSTILSMR